MLRIPLFVGCHEAADVPPIQLMWPLGMKAGHALVVTARIGYVHGKGGHGKGGNPFCHMRGGTWQRG